MDNNGYEIGYLTGKQKNDLKTKIEREKKSQRLPELSEKIYNLAKDHSRITVAFISGELNANRNTVKKHLQNLVKAGRQVSRDMGSDHGECIKIKYQCQK